MPTFAYLGKATKLILAGLEFSSYAQMNTTIFLEKNKQIKP